MNKRLIKLLLCLTITPLLLTIFVTGVLAVNPSLPNFNISDSVVQQTPQVTGINTNQIQSLRITDIITRSDGTRAVVLQNGKTYPLQSEEPLSSLISVEATPLHQIPENVALQLKKIPSATVDLRPWQTPIRDQAGRNTCVSFATIAAVEARYKRLDPVKYANIDLSEQYVNHVQKMHSLCEEPKIDTSLRENQHGAWGGSNLYYLVPLFTRWYSIPPESLLPYIPGESYENTNEAEDNPRIDWQNHWVTQRVINDFNLDPSRWSVETIKGATYGISSYCCFPDNKLNDLHFYKSVLAAGYEVIINYNVMSPDPNPDDDIWQPGPYKDGMHAVTIVGYDEQRRVFIVKNSWGYDNPTEKGFTLFSFDYILGGHVKEAVYITGVKEDTSTLPCPEQLLLGRWKMNHNGQKGILDIYRVPIFYDWFWNKADYRIGTYFAQDGTVYRVNGKIENHKLIFYIDFQNKHQDYDELNGQKFTAYLFTREPVIMAGEFTDSASIKYGFYATKENYYSSIPVPGQIKKSSYVGTWQMNHDGWQGILEIESVNSAGKVNGIYVAQDGTKYDISGTVSANNKLITLVIPFAQANKQQFIGYIHTREPGIITGITEWNGIKYGFLARRTGNISVIAPTNLTAEPLSANSITLRWQDNSYNETGFVIERKATGSPYYVKVRTTDANTTILFDTGLAHNKTYTYRVKAIKGTISSPYSNEASTKPKEPTIIEMPKITIPGAQPQDPIPTEKPNITIPKDPITTEDPKITIPKDPIDSEKPKITKSKN